MARPKISVIGAGNVGATVAHVLMTKRLGDVVLFDVIEGTPQGKALDIQESAPIEGWSEQMRGTNRCEDTALSNVIVITAGMARKPGMSRDDLLETNVQIVRQVIQQLAPLSPDAHLVLVTNPSDVMAQVAFQTSGFRPERIIGLGGVLDAARFRSFVAAHLGVSYRDVTAFVLGGHGDDMVPLVRYTYAGGIPIERLIDGPTLQALVERTRLGGAEIVNLLRTGSAYYAPAAAIASMVQAIVQDEKRILPVSAYVQGQFGMAGLFLGVPVVLGAQGVERILEVELNAEEQARLMKSAEAVRRVMTRL